MNMNIVEINGHPTVDESNGLMEEMNGPSTADEKNDLKSEMNDDFVAAENDGLHEFVNKLMLSEQRAETVIKMIVGDLKNAFKNQFPYEIVPFGSYINGLRCVDSDVDVSLRIAPLVASPKHVPVLNKIKKYLYQNESFSHLVHVRKAKVPILKFKHVPTSVDCDLSVDNEIGVANTYLVKSYLSMNSNLKTVVLVLKHLLVMNDIKGTGKITTYILFWMVVFYMQQLDLLPPVRNARETSPAPRIISGWNCSTPRPLVEPLKDPYSIRSHVEQFCEFYDNFDLATLAVCPYLSCAIVAENLTNLNVPPELFSSFINNVRNATVYPFTTHIMNVHDPTYLNANLTRPVTQHTVDVFKGLCRNTREFLQKNPTIRLNELLTRNDPRLRVTSRFPVQLPPAIFILDDTTGPSKPKKRRKNVN